MKAEELSRLLRSQEHTTLEFKREWYKIDDADPVTRGRQRDELIRDILALANGSANSAATTAYLIVGVDDALNAEGERTLYGVEQLVPADLRKRILQLVSAACDPPLEDIDCEIILVDSVSILVIIVYPSPHLYETTRELQASSGTFSKHVVFTRHGEITSIASANERVTMLQLKRIRFHEIKNVPPVPFGAVVGALIGGLQTLTIADRMFGNVSGRVVGFVIGTVIFGLLGALLGKLYEQYLSVRTRWFRVPVVARVLVAFVAIGLALFWLSSIAIQIFR